MPILEVLAQISRPLLIIAGDIAILTGGQVISEDLGIKLENVSIDMLGRAHE